MKRTGLAFCVLLVGSLCLVIPSFGTLFLSRYSGYEETNSQVTPGSDNDIAVTFRHDDGTQETKYFPKGYELSLKDSPYTSKVNGTEVWVYTWKDSAGRYINNHIVLDSPITLEAERVSSSVNLLQYYYEEYSSRYSEKTGNPVNTDFGQNSPVHVNSNNDTIYNAGLDNQLETSNSQFWLRSFSTGTYEWFGYKDSLVPKWHTETAYYSDTTFYVKGDNGKSKGGTDNLTNSYGSPDKYAYARRNDTHAIGYTGDDGQSGANVSYTRSNSSIGLETHDADYLPGEENKYNKYYKPINLSDITNSPFNSNYSVFGSEVAAKYQSEYCPNRLVLNCDVVYTGKMTLGGLTGVMVTDRSKEPLGWTQLNYQGFIVGAYTEIDLNGYDLIIESNYERWPNEGKDNTRSVSLDGMLDSFGSITDSSKNRTGNLVIKSGATLYTPIVFEDMYREDAIPEAYLNGTSFMNMFRCPYLDCTTIFESGSKFYGKLFVSLGSATVTQDLKLIGPDSEFLIQLSKGRIIRTTFYNLDLFNSIALDDSGNLEKDYYSNPSIRNITYQKIRYVFDHATVVFNSLNMSIKVSFVGLLNINFSFSSYKYQMNIPPYFDFYSFGSDITLQQEYNFMAGCYLYGDESTILRFKSGSFDVGDCDLDYGKNQKNYRAAGLNLDTTYYPFTNSNNGTTGWYDTDKDAGDSTGDEGYGILVWQWSDFWNYYSNHPAKMDYFGKFIFDSGNQIPYVLGGIVNLRNNDDFLSSISGVNINLYSNSCLSAVNMANYSKATVVAGQKRRTFSAQGFYNAPLVSNGEILTPLEGAGIYPGKSRSSITSAFYDIKNRLVQTNIGTFAFMFDSNGPSNNIYWSNNTSLTNSPSANSLSGSWEIVQSSIDSDVAGSNTNNQATYISYNGKTYISCQGAFVQYNPNTNIAALMKMVGHAGRTNSNDDSYSTDGRDVYRVMKLNASGNWVVSSATTNMDGFSW